MSVNEAPSITCPYCNRTSYSKGDIDNKFCIVCGYHRDLSNSVHTTENSIIKRDALMGQVISQDLINDNFKAIKSEWERMVIDSGQARAVFVACNKSAIRFLYEYQMAKVAVEFNGLLMPELEPGLTVNIIDDESASCCAWCGELIAAEYLRGSDVFCDEGCADEFNA